MFFKSYRRFLCPWYSYDGIARVLYVKVPVIPNIFQLVRGLVLINETSSPTTKILFRGEIDKG